MTNWLDVFKSLLPNARAWRLTIDKTLRRFFEGLTVVDSDVEAFYDDIYNDLRPQYTRELDQWEDQFGLPASASLSEQERRDRLDAAWKALGGQSPRYIQDVLQAAGFDVYVHEWWEPSVEHPTGGSVNGDVTPIARDPFEYLWDGVSDRQFIGDGHDFACDGCDVFFDNAQLDPPGYALVNKIVTPVLLSVGAGHELAFAGGDAMFAGSLFPGGGITLKQYQIPTDPSKYPYFLYIGGETFPDVASVDAGRRNEFEALCLKICPTEQWLGMLITYS